MSIDRLKYFATVVETRNLRQAAEMAGISPPSMSKAISVLEKEIGHKLIHPDGRGIGITPKGLEVYKLSSGLLDEYRHFYKQVSSPIEKKKRLRMATFEVFSSYFMSTFLQTEKELDLLLLEMLPGKMEAAILDGTVDFGITYLPSPAPELEYREIGSFQMRIFGRDIWLKKSFKDWAFAIPTSEVKIHSAEIDSLDMWPKNAPIRNIKYYFELLETALQTSRQGLSVLHCPDFIVRLQNEQVKTQLQLQILPLPVGYKQSKPTKIYLVARKGNSALNLEGKFAKFLRSLN